MTSRSHSLTLLHVRTFSARVFFETGEGVCWLMPPLTTMPKETSTLVAKLTPPNVDPIQTWLHFGKTGAIVNSGRGWRASVMAQSRGSVVVSERLNGFA